MVVVFNKFIGKKQYTLFLVIFEEVIYMRMTFRWYGEKDDNITLQQIDQIPGMDGIVRALFDIPVGEVWPSGNHCFISSGRPSPII